MSIITDSVYVAGVVDVTLYWTAIPIGTVLFFIFNAFVLTELLIMVTSSDDGVTDITLSINSPSLSNLTNDTTPLRVSPDLISSDNVIALLPLDYVREWPAFYFMEQWLSRCAVM